MKKNKITRTLVLLIIFSILFCGCEMTNQNQETDPATYLVTQSGEEVNRLISYFKASYVELFDKVQNETDVDAQVVKSDIETLKNNIDKVDIELTQAVKDSKITEDAKKEYDKELETLKTDLDELDKKLES